VFADQLGVDCGCQGGFLLHFLHVNIIGSKINKAFLTVITIREKYMAEKTLGAAKLSTKGQVTVPADARRKFNLEVGDIILFVEQDGKLFLRKG
jgi:AbrB family looped-hinge helix DNA binding protein